MTINQWNFIQPSKALHWLLLESCHSQCRSECSWQSLWVMINSDFSWVSCLCEEFIVVLQQLIGTDLRRDQNGDVIHECSGRRKDHVFFSHHSHYCCTPLYKRKWWNYTPHHNADLGGLPLGGVVTNGELHKCCSEIFHYDFPTILGKLNTLRYIWISSWGIDLYTFVRSSQITWSSDLFCLANRIEF